jgi:rhomboid protease GluP
MDKRRMCPQCRAFITTDDRVCPYCHEKVVTRAVDRRDPGTILGGFIPHARYTTIIILLINFGMYAATLALTSSVGESRALAILGAKYGPWILAGQWWRLVTAGFLHGGLTHILMNSWVLFDLGAQVEEVYGMNRMIVFYFVSTVGGFFASTLWSPLSLSVGASAGIFGLIGAMIALGVRHRSALGDHIRSLYLRWAIYGLLFGLLPFFQIDNAAHIGGLAAGFGAGYLAGLPRISGGTTETLWRIISFFCLGVTALCFLLMYLWFAAQK